MIYEWMDAANEVDDEERDHIGECPTTTRQFWAWYYGRALGLLIVARPSLRASLLGEIEAGEWETCWHVASVLFESLPDSWSEYRQRALKFYNPSDIEYRQDGPRPVGATLPPHLNAQSDLYWAMRVGFAGRSIRECRRAEEYPWRELPIPWNGWKQSRPSSAQHALRTERKHRRPSGSCEKSRLPQP